MAKIGQNLQLVLEKTEGASDEKGGAVDRLSEFGDATTHTQLTLNISSLISKRFCGLRNPIYIAGIDTLRNLAHTTNMYNNKAEPLLTLPNSFPYI
jgi:hypothetical protein